MGNGHAGQTGSAGMQNFSMPDADSLNIDNFEAKNNPSLAKDATSWENAQADRDYQDIGNRAARSYKDDSELENNIQSKPEQTISLEMPPIVEYGRKADIAEINPAIIAKNSIDNGAIKAKDKLDLKNAKKIYSIVEAFNRGEEPLANFYEDIRAPEDGASARYVQIYGRDLGGGKQAA